MKYFCLAIIFIILGITSSCANILFQNNEFSIELPEGWIEIPADTISVKMKESVKIFPDIPEEHYDYGYQIKKNKFIVCPYILIQIENIGRLSENEWEELTQYSLENDIEEYYPNSSFDLQTDKINYDPKANIFWMKFDLNLDNIVENSGIRTMIPTEKGFIKMTGYSLRKDFSEYSPIFLKIAKSIQPSYSLKYKTRISDNLPLSNKTDWNSILVSAVSFAIIGIIISAIAKLIIILKNTETHENIRCSECGLLRKKNIDVCPNCGSQKIIIENCLKN